MFQSFDDFSDPAQGAEHTRDLKKELKSRGLDYFLIPRTDEYQGEYVAAYAERLAWISGFTGSAGFAIITPRKAVLFVDGRYTIQAAAQVDAKTYEILNIPETSPFRWLRENVKPGQKIGFDPNLITIQQATELSNIASELGAKKSPQKTNPIDTIWPDQPKPPMEDIRPHPIKYSGVKAADKITNIQQALNDASEEASILTDPLSIAWCFNIRGGDIPHTPVVLARAIIHKKARPQLFVDPEKLTPAADKHLKTTASIHPAKELFAALKKLAKSKPKIRLDPNNCPSVYADFLKKNGAVISHGTDLCIKPRAIKNTVEQSGSRTAHHRDGIAVTKFLAWLDESAAKSKLTEISAAKQLEQFRAETGALKELSFDTISGAGPNGAIVHYRVTQATDRRLKSGELYLVDSGAQYLEGTTDITRTVAIGRPSREMRDRFTRVLKGHIALADARFPIGTRGVDLDVLARHSLWAAGLDYDHGTGHGVGSYLAVHEGPQNISKRGMTPLEPGMIISNEPGFYKTGAYGIRIENLVLVNKASEIKGGERKMLSFETLTLAPIDLRLVNADMLNKDELNWLNNYHKRVEKELRPHLAPKEQVWLKSATAALTG